MKYKLDFYTQYNQFYVVSDNAAILSANQFDDNGYDDRLTMLKNMIVVRTESYGHVKGEVVFLDGINANIDLNEYDHVVEGGLFVESGNLQILNCPFSAVELEFNVEPGVYRVRVYSSNMLGYDSDEDEDDSYYKIEMWPDTSMERRVLKRYTPI
jgi:hypothetical protein